jgi:acetoin utilization deacetylase AcuC-like enzyme
VLVSAGFDAHAADPLGGMQVSEQGFEVMTQALLSVAREHANGRLLAVLEGGYNVGALSSSVETVLRTMVHGEGDGGVAPRPAPPTGQFGEVFARIQAAQSSYWKL